MSARFGQADHRPFGAFGVELAYGRRPNGEIVHISTVVSGLQCHCTCPACGRTLVARKGDKTAHHFAHFGAGTGCGAGVETNAHIWAKKVLERTRRILLPAIAAEQDGRKLVARKAGVFVFDEVRLEERLGQIVPDVILKAKDRELIVEIWVTHKCDDEKIAKIRRGGISAIEVDLSRLRAAASEKEVETALLQGASRTWLFNPFLEVAADQLRTQITAEKAAKADALRRRAKQVAAAIRSARPELSDTLRAEREQLVKLGLRGCFEQPVATGDGFVVPPSMWQAAIFSRVFLPQAGKPRWGRVGLDAGCVLDDITDCLAPPLRKSWGLALSKAVAEEAPELVLPVRAVAEYLRSLADAGVLHDDGDAFSLSDRQSEAIAARIAAAKLEGSRLEEVRRQVTAIVERLPGAERRDFDLETWFDRRLRRFSLTPRQLTSAESGRWWEFREALGGIDIMFAGAPVPADFLGLPLEAAGTRATEAIRRKEVERERKAEEAQVAAAERRLAILRERTSMVFGTEDAPWINRPGRSGGPSPALAAQQSDQGLQAAMSALDRIGADRAAKVRADQIAAEAREDLRRAAENRLPEGHAPYFLGSAHPGIGGERPIDFCRDAVTLRRCLQLLPDGRSRGRR